LSPHRTSLLTCFPNPPGGAHNTTLHPSGDYLAISNPSSDWAVDIIDLRNLPTRDFLNRKRHIYRFIDESRRDMPGRCPAGASFECIVIERPPVPNLGSRRTDVPYNQFDTTGCRPASQAPRKSACGLWRPHDVFFSLDGDKMYVAALNSTFIVNVDRVPPWTSTQHPTASVPHRYHGDGDDFFTKKGSRTARPTASEVPVVPSLRGAHVSCPTGRRRLTSRRTR